VARLLLLLPTATYRAPDFLAAARSLGVEVVVGSERSQAMAHDMGDRALVVALADPVRAVEAIAGLHRRAPIDGIVGVDDQAVLVAALAAARLGLRNNPPAAVSATRDKTAMRRALAGGGIPQPDFRVLGPGDDAAAAARAVGLPCVVKPVSLAGSRGVIRVDDAASVAAAADRVRAIVADAGGDGVGALLVEGYVPGDEVAVEGLLRGGRLDMLAVFDKPDRLEGPYFEETIYVTPSRLPPATLALIEQTTAAAAGVLGLIEGPIHAELRVDGARLAVLEIAARSIGGLCSRSLRFGVGVSLEEVIVRHALGLPLDDLSREAEASGVMMIPIAAAGTLQRIGGQEKAKAVPGIVGLEVSVAPGRPVRPLPEGDRYLGFLFARGSSPAAVEDALRKAHACLDVVIAAPAN
jgi:biotin carboxylase